ncbi:astakine [Lasioglossum baleicum]|uniref:astakine n=1 Tax=Lasioglossum baleicum TaxID=434251 RepID=UPI003FCC4F4A
MAPILLAFLLSFSCLSHATGRPDYIHCQNNLECGAGHCCTIGAIRYSTPQCRPMQAAGETCRPSSASTINMTASYPDGAQVLLTDVHYILCPCADGLFCDQGTCSESAGKHDSNVLIGENRSKED